MASIYRAYLRTFDGAVTDKTVTGDATAAAEAFTALINRDDVGVRKLAAVLSYNNRQLAFHRFDRAPGDADYWRDKLDAIEWPTGQRGRPAQMDGGRRVQVYLDAESLAAAERIGHGNVSEGIRAALKRGDEV